MLSRNASEQAASFPDVTKNVTSDAIGPLSTQLIYDRLESSSPIEGPSWRLFNGCPLRQGARQGVSKSALLRLDERATLQRICRARVIALENAVAEDPTSSRTRLPKRSCEPYLPSRASSATSGVHIRVVKKMLSDLQCIAQMRRELGLRMTSP